MKVADKGTPLITLRNEAGEEINLLIHSYDTYSDEIVLKSNIRETDLKRGWVGDMFCYVPAGMDLATGKVVDGTDRRNVYHNVLLRSIESDSAELQEPVTWVYTFLKD